MFGELKCACFEASHEKNYGCFEEPQNIAALRLVGYIVIAFFCNAVDWWILVSHEKKHGYFLLRHTGQFVELLFGDVLDDDNIVLTNETTADDVEEWDSLNHIQLVVAIEKKFGIRFLSHEIRSWNNVGELVNSISNRIN